MMQARDELLAALREAMRAMAPDSNVLAAFEAPKLAAHGDLACTAAMALAKPLRKSPRDVATTLIAALQAQPAVRRWVDSMEIAGPGFINFQLKPSTRQNVVREVLTTGVDFGRTHIDASGTDNRVIVEFVSANPTGPLHVGHARQAALGDAICHLLETQGRAVTREFYYNDAGVQIATLGASTQMRVRGMKPGDAAWDAAGSTYAGDYVADIAADFMAGATVQADDRAFTGSADADDVAGMREFAVAYLRHEQDLDLQAFGVRFDSYFLESSLYTTGRVDDTVRRLVRSGHTYENDGALWLRSTDYGDDKDRVMRKSDGTYTYFVPDVAYHLAKFERGFHHAINIQGGDHHGTIARVRAGLQAADMGVPADYPSYVLHKMVTVMKGGEEVKISKRAGSYVTLRDLIDWTSRDAVRFFLLSRKADTEFTFDVDLALKQNDENPVFYVQYAHARICSVLRQFVEQGGALDALVDVDLTPLVAPSEVTLMRKLAEFPGLLETAARNLAPHEVAFYLRDVAAAFHSYYAAERFLVDDPHLQRARLALLAATAQIIRNALAVLGVSAPERMAREPLAEPPATA